MTNPAEPNPQSRVAAAPGALELFLLFCRIGLTSFGGGTSGWIYREIVGKKRWMAEDDFFNVFALCQALPGVNVVNLAVWMGRRLLGIRGAAIACAGIVAIPSILIVLLASAASGLVKYGLTQTVLAGASAAAVASPFAMGIRMGFNVRVSPLPLAVMAATFLAVGVIKLPLVWVAPAGAVVSVLGEYLRRDAT